MAEVPNDLARAGKNILGLRVIQNSPAALREGFAISYGQVADQSAKHLRGVSPGSMEMVQALTFSAHDAIGDVEGWSGGLLPKLTSPALECAAGCAYCCHIPVTVSVPELAYVLYGLRQLEKDVFDVVLGRVRHSAHRLAGMSNEERAQVNIPCPFLAPDNKCSVYEFRPIACRSWTSFSVEKCRQAYDDPANPPTTPTFAPLHHIREYVQEALADGMRQAGLEPYYIDLAKAFGVLVEEPSALANWQTSAPLKAAKPFMPKVTPETMKHLRKFV